MPRKKIKVVSDATCRIPNAHEKNHPSKGKAACGFLILDENDGVLFQGGSYLGEITVPQAEYQGLINALDKASEYSRGEVHVYMDSELVIRQMNGDYALKSENMKPLYHKVKTLEQRFLQGVKYFHHPRTAALAKQADKLADAALNAVIAS